MGTAAGLHVCTIVARNYLPAARVLADSFLDQHPDGHMTVLVIDDVDVEIDGAKEQFELLRPEDLFEDRVELHRMETIYELTELATSFKPWLLRHLLDAGAPCALYLDPDIRVYDRLDELSDLAERTGITLIPHAREPLPRDGKMTSESAILATGVYNLGFIAVGAGAQGFLDFWQERLRRECRNDPTNMRFVDQRWIDFVPGMFDCVISREPRFNVAYWNLHERDVVWTGERYEVEGKPLGFFHFSGYSPDARHVLSRHQVERPRILLSERPGLRKLFGEYGDALESAGYGEIGGSQNLSRYGLGKAVNGLRLDRHVRRLYLNRLLGWESGDEGADPPPDPFDPDGASELVDWLNSVVSNPVGPSRLTLYEGTLYAHTPELQTRFPDPQDQDFTSFVDWFEREASAGELDPLLVCNLRDRVADPAYKDAAPIPEWDTESEPASGITIAGYMNALHSIGELGRLTELAVVASGIPFQSVLYEPGDSAVKILSGSRRSESEPRNFGTNLARGQCGPGAGVRVAGRRLVLRGPLHDRLLGMGAGGVPRQLAGVVRTGGRGLGDLGVREELDRVRYGQARVQRAATRCRARDRAGSRARESSDSPRESFVFLFCFDFQSVVERKNPLALVEAFMRAFEPDDGPLLVLKTINGTARPMDLEMVRIACVGSPRHTRRRRRSSSPVISGR